MRRQGGYSVWVLRVGTHSASERSAQLEPWHWRYGSKRSTAQVLAKLHATIQRAERPERRSLERIGRLPRVDTKAHAERDEDGEDVRDSLAKQPREQLCCVCGC